MGARVVKQVNSASKAVANVVTIPLPAHDPGDVLQIFVGVDFGTLTTPATLTQDAYINGGEDLYSFSHVGEATPLTFIAITSSNGTTPFTYHIYVCKGVPITSYVSATQTKYDGSTTGNPTATALTPLDNNALVFVCAVGGGNITTLPPIGWFDGGCSNSESSAISSSSAYTHQETAASTGAVAFPLGSDIKDRFSYIVIAFKSTDTLVEPRCSGVPANIIHAMGNDCGHEGIAEVNLTSVITTVGGFPTRNEIGTEVVGGLIDGYRNASVRSGSSNFTGQAILQATPLVAPKDFTGMKLSVAPVYLGKRTPRTYADYSSFFGLYDSVNLTWRIWRIKASDTIPSIKTRTMSIIDVSGGFHDEENPTGNVFSLTAVTHIIFGRVLEANASAQEMCFYPVYDLQTLSIIGGNALRPVSFQTAVDLAKTAGLNTIQNQSDQSLGQFYATQDISTGDGVSNTVWDSTGQSIEFPSALDIVNGRVQSKIATASLSYTIDSDAVLASNTFNMGDAHNFIYKSGTVNGVGLVLNGTVNLSNVTGAITDWTFFNPVSVIASCDMTGGNKFIGLQSPIVVSTQAEFENLVNNSFDKSVGLSIIITGNHNLETWSASGMKISNGLNTYDIEYQGTGTLKLSSDSGSGVIQSRVNATNGTLTIQSPQPTLTITGFPTGATIVINDLDNIDPQNKGSELYRSENSTTDLSYVGTAGNLISISMYEPNYKAFYEEYTLTTNNSIFTIKPKQESN